VTSGARAGTVPLMLLITETWQEVLGITGIGLDDDFLELGGNSLHAVRIVGRVEEKLDIYLSVRSVLEARTVRLMTAHVQRALAQHRDAS
jgi:acyl carrier protein